MCHKRQFSSKTTGRVTMSRKLLITALTSSAAAVTLAAGSRAAQANTYAGNLYSPTYQHEYRHGVVSYRTIETWQKMHAWRQFKSRLLLRRDPDTLRFNGVLVFFRRHWPLTSSISEGVSGGVLVPNGARPSTDSNGNVTLSKDTKGEVPAPAAALQGVGNRK